MIRAVAQTIRGVARNVREGAQDAPVPQKRREPGDQLGRYPFLFACALEEDEGGRDLHLSSRTRYMKLSGEIDPHG
jgi:hypothetical protein